MILRSLILTGFFITLFSACKRDPDIPDAVLCRVVTVSDKLDVNGQLTDQMQRTLVYTDGQLTQIGERNTDREVNLKLEYGAGGTITKAAEATFALNFGYTAGTTYPTSATAIRNGAVQATYEMAYSSGNKLTRVLESRQVLPANSLVRSREYRLVYDAEGLLKTEKLTSTLTDRSTVEQETDYNYGTLVHPLVNIPQPTILTVMALSLWVEVLPGRFWQGRVLQDYKTYNAKNGARGTLRESAMFTVKTDANGRVSGQEQNTVNTSASGQNTQRKNQHGFSYECK